MKIFYYTTSLLASVVLCNCSNLTSLQTAPTEWKHEKPSENTSIDTLLMNGKRIYMRTHSKILSGHMHLFIWNEKIALSISDDFENDILGANLSFDPKSKVSVQTMDLNKDSKVDLVFITSRDKELAFARFKDDKFSLLGDKEKQELETHSSILNYLKTTKSEQVKD